MRVSSASVLICTYNRETLLRATLAAFRELVLPEQCSVELIVVDNNSSDHTAAVVAEAADASPITVRYLHEGRQGKSFALNAGLAHAHGDIVALTDDDVIPARDWLARIVGAFRAHEVTFVFGRVLPNWERTPPPELLTPAAQDIWGPLAIVDYGPHTAEYRAEHTGQRLPIGANLAFARHAILAAGGWRTDLGKVDNTLISGEDHEIFLRLRRMNLYAGLYDPEILVKHYVPASRLTRAYFRRWFLWHGKTHAIMLDELFLDLDMSRVPRIAGVPRFLYRQGLAQIARYLRSLVRGDALGVLIEELRTLQYLGLYGECWRRAWRASRPASVARGGAVLASRTTGR